MEIADRKPMRILAFRHAASEHLGLIGNALDHDEISYDYADLRESPGNEPVREAYALIFMGGLMSVNDDLPYIHREMQHIKDAIERGKPVLGVCLGTQLIAKALGAQVYPNAVKEIGWAPVTFTDTARRDPLFHGLRSSEVIFHWHGETFDLPPRAPASVSTECPLTITTSSPTGA